MCVARRAGRLARALSLAALAGCTEYNPGFDPAGLSDAGGGVRIARADLAGVVQDLGESPRRDLAGPPPAPDLAMLPEVPARSVLVAGGATWRYLDDGSSPGEAYRAPAFDDRAWRSGRAELGYGDGDEATVVSFGRDRNNKFITTYFRLAFDADNVDRARSLELAVVRDDGVIVHLNGVEVLRDNLPGGPIGSRTLALDVIGNQAETTPIRAALDPARLVNGRNVVTAEIHQAAEDSSDISFNLELVAVNR